MASLRKQLGHKQVTLELAGSLLRVVAVQRESAGVPSVRTQEVRWRKEASTLHSESGLRELTAALKQVAASHKLAGTEVRLALNGDFCVTRVATGSAEQVKYEMGEVENRSQLYLTLGPGRKALAGSIRQIDARHQHALLTVTNHRTVDALVTALSSAGLKIRHVEPSLFALTRIVSRLELDRDEPVMVLNMAEKGVEVGIFFQGMLLLEYRPGGRAVHQDVAQIMLQHLPRLRRYVGRNFRFITGDLRRVYLCGEPEAIERMQQDFSAQDKLTALPLDISGLATSWDFGGALPSGSFASVLGAALAAAGTNSADTVGPNLLHNLEQQTQMPLGKKLRALLWPAAVAAAVIVGGLVLNERAAREVAYLQGEFDALSTVRLEALRLRGVLSQAENKEQQFKQLASRLTQPDWSRLWATIGGCLPPDVWIESLKIDGDGRISLTGMSYSEPAAFEMVRWLKRAPQFAEVALTSTRPMRYNSQDAVNFQLEGRLAKFEDSAERTVRND